MWTCPKCGAAVEPSFDVCWRCGTTPEGVEDPDFVTADEIAPIDDPVGYLKLDPGALEASDLPAPPLELAACFASNVAAEAKFVADQLAAEGIAATLQNVHGGGAGLPSGAFSRYPACVVVRADDLPRAREWVAGYRRRREARRPSGD